ncbi:MAG: tetratricopeptide repeat protein [Bacteroidetes bacterium]|nr:tetratricopeptide repeat protein [Bacteroidota bacterium]
MRIIITIFIVLIVLISIKPLYGQEAIESSDTAEILIQKGRTHYSDGQYLEAIRILHMNGIDTLDAVASSLAGLSYSAINDFGNACFYLKTACRLDSNNVAYRFQLGTFLSQSGLIGDAEQEYKQIIAIDSTFLPAFVRLGIIYSDQKYYQQAKSYFSYVVDINPRDYLSFYYLGILSFGLGQRDTAMYFLDRSIKLNNGFVQSIDFLASLYYSKKNYLSAIQLYQKASQLRPTNAEFIFKEGLCNRQLKEYDKAILCFSKAVAIDSTNPSYFAQLGYAYYYKERYDSSIYFNCKAISYDNENIQYYNNLAAAYQKVDSTDKLIDVYYKMIDLHDPDEIADIYTRIALVYSSKRLNLKAIHAYKSALAIKPSNPYALFSLGSLSQQSGNLVTARWAYEEYLHVTASDSSENATREYVKHILKELKSKSK